MTPNTISLSNIELNIEQLIVALKKLDPEVRLHIADQLAKPESSQKAVSKRAFGAAKGQIIIEPNFDDPIEGFEEYMP